MSTPRSVQRFYEQIWNNGEVEAASELLMPNVRFRGSLGIDSVGRDGFLDYVRSVRAALDSYRCEILECLAEGEHAFAQMRFSGRHVGVFRGYEPTGKSVSWLGAALFRLERDRIVEVWVLGDLAGLDALLSANA